MHRRGGEGVKFVTHTRREDVEVGKRVSVGGDPDRQRAGVGEGADAQRLVGDEGQEREHLEDARSGKVKGRFGTRDAGAGDVDALADDGHQQQPPADPAADHQRTQIPPRPGLPRGCLERDLPEPATGIGLAKVERHGHLGDEVALLRTAQSAPQRYRDVDPYRRVAHPLAAALQQRAQTAGNRRQ